MLKNLPTYYFSRISQKNLFGELLQENSLVPISLTSKIHMIRVGGSLSIIAIAIIEFSNESK